MSSPGLRIGLRHVQPAETLWPLGLGFAVGPIKSKPGRGSIPR